MNARTRRALPLALLIAALGACSSYSTGPIAVPDCERQPQPPGCPVLTPTSELLEP